MDLNKRLEALIKLGDFINTNIEGDEFKELFAQAHIHNNWFTEEFCKLSFSSIASYYLNEIKLKKWISNYTISDKPQNRKIGLILAGNIPLVGIHDIISVFISGNICLLKLSSKDSVLTKYLIKKLNEIAAESKAFFQFDDKLKGIDALIATGSDNSARYFEYYFRDCPNIIRKNRNSIAILTGTESDEDLQSLEEDIFMYFGLGCRSVSKIFIPADYDLSYLLDRFGKYKHFIDHHKYFNNYIYHKSIFNMNLDEYMDNDYLMLKESTSSHSPLAVLFYERYQKKEEIEEVIASSKDQLQVIISNEEFSFPTVAFGKSQFPELWDYADNVDVLKFLIKQ